MSTGSEITDPSANNFTKIWKFALDEYQTVMGKSLETLQTHSLDGCTDPEVILDVFRTQAQALSGSRKNDKNLMTSLDHTVRIASGFSEIVSRVIWSVCLFCDIWFSAVPTRKNNV